MKPSQGLLEKLQKLQAQSAAPPEYVKRQVIRKVPGSAQEILVKESTVEGDTTGLVTLDCGCRYPAWILNQKPKLVTESWTGAECCKDHFRVCDGLECGRSLCIAGRADGFRLDYDGKTYWLCPDHFELWRKEILRQNFWAGFKRGLFGGGDE